MGVLAQETWVLPQRPKKGRRGFQEKTWTRSLKLAYEAGNGLVSWSTFKDALCLGKNSVGGEVGMVSVVPSTSSVLRWEFVRESLSKSVALRDHWNLLSYPRSRKRVNVDPWRRVDVHAQSSAPREIVHNQIVTDWGEIETFVIRLVVQKGQSGRGRTMLELLTFQTFVTQKEQPNCWPMLLWRNWGNGQSRVAEVNVVSTRLN